MLFQKHIVIIAETLKQTSFSRYKIIITSVILLYYVTL